MIRRDATFADGRPGWLLISQIEHARLSGELAAACRPDVLLPVRGVGHDAPSHPTPPVADLTQIRAEIIAAITHHDDGWREWEQAPTLDADGRPRSFTQLPLVEALRIWTESIDAAATDGPLAGWMVAGHFRRLLDDSDTLAGEPLADLWRVTQDRAADLRLDEWRFAAPTARTPALADAALLALRAFDAASLWFCCGCEGTDAAAPDEEAFACGPLQLALAGGQTTISPSASGAIARPWIFDKAELELTTPCLLAPARRYESPQDLHAACEPSEIRWSLRPAP